MVFAARVAVPPPLRFFGCGLGGLLAKSLVAVLFFSLLKWKGWSVTDLIETVKRR